MMERAELMRSDLEEDPFDVLTDEERDEVGEDAGEQWPGGAVVLGKDVPAEGLARGEVVAGVDDAGHVRGDDDGGEGEGDDGVEPAGDGVGPAGDGLVPGGEWDEGWVESDGGGAEKEVGEEEDPGMVLIRQLVREFSVKTLAERTGLTRGSWLSATWGSGQWRGMCWGGCWNLRRAGLTGVCRKSPGRRVGKSWVTRGGVCVRSDLDQDGVPDFEVPGVHRVAKGEKWSEMMERRRRSLWSGAGAGVDDAVPAGDDGGGAGGGGGVSDPGGIWF